MIPDGDSLDVDVPAIDQVGLVVRDLAEGMDRFGAAFGVDEWAVFRFEPPALEQTTYRGEQTDQRWRLCLATVGAVDVELIEPIAGENSYTQHLAEHGEGLHHVACFSFEDPVGAVEAYRDAGVPVLQSGVYRDGTFWYLDIREAGDGVVFEVVDLGDSGPPEPDRVYAV